jgi:hypothetical protein
MLCEQITLALCFGVVHEKNGFLKRTRAKTATGSVDAIPYMKISYKE